MANSAAASRSRSVAEKRAAVSSSIGARGTLLLGLPGAERIALDLVSVLLVDQLLVERQALVVEGVSEALALGAEVGLVVLVWNRLDGHLVGDRQAVALEPVDLLRIVGEDPDTGQSQVDEDLSPDPVIAQVGRKPEPQVRVHRVEAILLEPVGAQLVEQPDSAALLRQVEQDPRPLALDHR